MSGGIAQLVERLVRKKFGRLAKLKEVLSGQCGTSPYKLLAKKRSNLVRRSVQNLKLRQIFGLIYKMKTILYPALSISILFFSSGCENLLPQLIVAANEKRDYAEINLQERKSWATTSYMGSVSAQEWPAVIWRQPEVPE